MRYKYDVNSACICLHFVSGHGEQIIGFMQPNSHEVAQSPESKQEHSAQHLQYLRSHT